MTKNIQSHFVVVYNHLTNSFEIDEDTTWSKFQDGRVFVDEKGWIEPDSKSKLAEEIGDASVVLNELLASFNPNKEISTSIFSINKVDVINSLPDIDKVLTENITQSQLEEIAEMARESLGEELDDVFWESWSDAVCSASQIVLGRENDNDDFDLLDKTMSEVDLPQA